jgi:hypothetical protein
VCSCELLTADGKDSENENRDLSGERGGSEMKIVSSCGKYQTNSMACGSLEEMIRIPRI